MKYYKIETNEIINVQTEIPVELLEKKGLLIYKKNIISIPDTEIKPEDYSQIKDNYFIQYTYNYYHVPTFEEVKINKKQEIKNTYIELTNEGYLCSNNIKLDCRESDKINWLTLKLNCNAYPTMNFSLKDFNNQVHNLGATVILNMLSELELYYNKLLTDKWKIESLLEACTTIEELENVYWRKPILDEENLNIISYKYNEVL